MTTTPKAAIRRLAAARLISITGGAAAYVGLTFAIYERTRSPGWVAATLLLTFGANGLILQVEALSDIATLHSRSPEGCESG